MCFHVCVDYLVEDSLVRTCSSSFTQLELSLSGSDGDGSVRSAAPLYHNLTFALLASLPPGTEFWVHELVSCVVFHPQLFP